MSYRKNKSSKMLLIGVGFKIGEDKVPMKEMYDDALEANMGFDKKIAKLFELNKLAYENLILSINTRTAVDKMALGLGKGCCS